MNLSRLVRAALITLTIGATLSACHSHRRSGGDSAPPRTSQLIGAPYYLWYPENLAQGTLRTHLIPKQGPDASYDSTRPETAERAIAAASKGGLDFFALDWWPDRPDQDRNVDAFLRARNAHDIKFCLLYETQALGFDRAHEATVVDGQVAARFRDDLVSLADRYFSRPGYLRVHGRPVIMLYLSRTLTGPVRDMIEGARQALAARGFDPYIIGDEIFWRVTLARPPTAGPWLTREPQAARLQLFDAVMAYCLYASGAPEDLSPQADYTGYPGTTDVVRHQIELYAAYSEASKGQVPVIPSVYPGVNTRGVRLAQNQSAVPREWLPGEGAGSTLKHLLHDVAAPLTDRRAPIVFVTSWNEWNEDTAIEPVAGRWTATDDSPTGHDYTQGYKYGGEGDAAIQAIRDFTTVAWGRVRVRGNKTQTVNAYSDDGTIVASTTIDRQHFFVLRRTEATHGRLHIGLVGSRPRHKVAAHRDTAVRVDLP